MTRPAGAEQGFTLIETLIALGVLSFGLMALAQMFVVGVVAIAGAGVDMVARQKATEAIESVYTARDTRTISWAEIHNVAGGTGDDGGVFLDGEQPLGIAGADGLVNTADDGAVEAIMMPGPDGQLGTEDDVAQPLSSFTREIAIRDAGPNLRRIEVTIRYLAGGARRRYAIATLISSFA